MKWDVILMLCAYSFTSRYIKAKNRASSRLLAQNRVSQVFWEPIKNRATPRSALLKAVYLEALLYFLMFLGIKNTHSYRNNFTRLCFTAEKVGEIQDE